MFRILRAAFRPGFGPARIGALLVTLAGARTEDTSEPGRWDRPGAEFIRENDFARRNTAGCAARLTVGGVILYHPALRPGSGVQASGPQGAGLHERRKGISFPGIVLCKWKNQGGVRPGEMTLAARRLAALPWVSFFFRRLVHLFNTIRSVLARAAAGDLQVSAAEFRTVLARKDELGALAAEFLDVVNNLHTGIGGVRDRAAPVRTAAEGLAATAEQQARSGESTARAVGGAAGDALGQARASSAAGERSATGSEGRGVRPEAGADRPGSPATGGLAPDLTGAGRNGRRRGAGPGTQP